MDATSLIRHHNWLWPELIHPKAKVDVVAAEDLIVRIAARPQDAGAGR
jgi:hypothetical protein